MCGAAAVIRTGTAAVGNAAEVRRTTRSRCAKNEYQAPLGNATVEWVQEEGDSDGRERWHSNPLGAEYVRVISRQLYTIASV